MDQVLTHPFQKTIGPGPYKHCGSYDMGAALAHQQAFGDTASAFRDAPRLVAGMGTCAHCGMAILNIQIIERGDGKRYGVGSDCVLKTNEYKLVSAMKLEKNRIAREKRQKKNEERRISMLAAQRERNGGLTDYELSEKKREEAKAAAAEARKPIAALLSPLADALADGRGGFCDSIARQMREGFVPKGGAFDITLDILSKLAGRANSKAYAAERERVYAILQEAEARGQS